MSADWQTDLRTTEKLVALGDDAQERPSRHTFILRLVPTFSDDPNAEPRWHGELEVMQSKNVTSSHFCRSGKVLELLEILSLDISSILNSNKTSGHRS